jgi:hypothetical protein
MEGTQKQNRRMKHSPARGRDEPCGSVHQSASASNGGCAAAGRGVPCPRKHRPRGGTRLRPRSNNAEMPAACQRGLLSAAISRTGASLRRRRHLLCRHKQSIEIAFHLPASGVQLSL